MNSAVLTTVRRWPVLPRVALALVVLAAMSVWQSNFLTEGNMFTVMEGLALVGMVALGVGLTIIAGEFDLSVGSIAAVAGILAIQFSTLGLWPAVILVTLAAGIFGAVQSYALVRLNINSLVFTIATSIALRGFAYVISSEKTVVADNLSQSEVLREQFGILSPFSMITIACFVLVAVFVTKTRFGREIYAVGGGRVEARGAGLREMRPLVVAFTISGALAGLAGALSAAKAGSAQPTGFEELLLPAVTAALIGGVSLRGGVGTIFGIFLGAFTLRCLISGLYLDGAAFYIENLATGVLLLVVLALEMTGKSWEQIKFMFDKRRRIPETAVTQ